MQEPVWKTVARGQTHRWRSLIHLIRRSAMNREGRLAGTTSVNRRNEPRPPQCRHDRRQANLAGASPV